MFIDQTEITDHMSFFNLTTHKIRFQTQIQEQECIYQNVKAIN